MGRDKGPKVGGKAEKSEAASSTEEANTKTASAATHCGLCRREVAIGEEEHISGECSKCGHLPFHTDCVREHLEKTLKPQVRNGGYGTKAWERILMKLRQRPCDMFAKNGTSQRLTVTCPACSEVSEGSMDSATMAKPGRKLVLPPPPAPRQKQQQQPPAAAPAAAKKPPQQAHVQTRGQSWTAVRSQGSRAVGGSAGAARPAGGYSKAGSFSASSGGYTHIPNRPVWLQMCPDLEGDGDCFRYRCKFCHSREEQEEREAEYLEEQKEQKERAREQRQAELEAYQRQQAAAAEGAASAAAEEQRRRQAAPRQDLVAREEAALQLSDDALQLMKRYKRAQCITSLTEMGFDEATAAAAAEASGCEPTAAATLLMEGGSAIAGGTPASVLREARELLTVGASLGLTPPAVEVALAVVGGNWQQARWELEQQARLAKEVAAAAAASASAAAPAASAAVSSSAAATAGAGAGAGLSPMPVPGLSPMPVLLSRQASSASSNTVHAFPTQSYQATGAVATESSSVWGVQEATFFAAATPQPAAGGYAAAGSSLWPQTPAAAPEPAAFDARFAAGLAAAMQAAPPAPAWQQHPEQLPQQQQQVPAAVALAWLPPHLEKQQAVAAATDEEEMDELMLLMGIGG